MRRVNVIGVGMTKFTSPKALRPYTEMGQEAVRDALKDAGVDYKEIQQAYAGWVFADSCAGQKVLYDVGMTGIPIFNVNNNCSTGFDRAVPGPPGRRQRPGGMRTGPGLRADVAGRPGFGLHRPSHPYVYLLREALRVHRPVAGAAPAGQLFAGAGLEHQRKYGTKDETFAKISVKARKHAQHNERAIFRDQVTVEEVLASPSRRRP